MWHAIEQCSLSWYPYVILNLLLLFWLLLRIVGYAINHKAQASHSRNICHFQIKVQELIPCWIWSTLCPCGFDVAQCLSPMIDTCSDTNLNRHGRQQIKLISYTLFQKIVSWFEPGSNYWLPIYWITVAKFYTSTLAKIFPAKKAKVTLLNMPHGIGIIFLNFFEVSKRESLAQDPIKMRSIKRKWCTPPCICLTLCVLFVLA